MNGRVAVIYYSATGNVHALAQAVADGAEEEGAEVCRRHVEELASALHISENQHWGRHRSVVSEDPVATLDDLEWADGVAFGTPTRFGNVAAQLKQLIDQAGRLWQASRRAATPTAHPSPQATGPDASALDVARYQGQRLARYAAVIAEARSRGAFAVRRPSSEAFLGATLT